MSGNEAHKGREFLLAKIREEPERFITLSSYLKEAASRSGLDVARLLDRLADAFESNKSVSNGLLDRMDPKQLLARIHAIHDDYSNQMELDDTTYTEQTYLVSSLKSSAERHSVSPEALLGKIEKEIYFNALHIDLEDTIERDRSAPFEASESFSSAAMGLREAYKKMLKTVLIGLDVQSTNPFGMLLPPQRGSSIEKELNSSLQHLAKTMDRAKEHGFSFSVTADRAKVITDSDVLQPTDITLEGRLIKYLPEEAEMYIGDASGNRIAIMFGDLKEVALLDQNTERRSTVYSAQTFLLALKEILVAKGADSFMMAHLLSEARRNAEGKGMSSFISR